jgi:hypothetical protein
MAKARPTPTQMEGASLFWLAATNEMMSDMICGDTMAKASAKNLLTDARRNLKTGRYQTVKKKKTLRLKI